MLKFKQNDRNLHFHEHTFFKGEVCVGWGLAVTLCNKFSFRIHIQFIFSCAQSVNASLFFFINKTIACKTRAALGMARDYFYLKKNKKNKKYFI